MSIKIISLKEIDKVVREKQKVKGMRITEAVGRIIRHYKCSRKEAHEILKWFLENKFFNLAEEEEV